MHPLTVTFHIPKHIAQGLKDQSLERIGGVIRDAKTKEVVMWLRDSGSAPQFPSLLQLGSTANILNLGISTIGFAIVIQKLNELDTRLKTVEALLKKIDQKLDIVFSTTLRTGVDLAIDAFNMTKAENRKNAAFAAITCLMEAENAYESLIDQELAHKSSIIDEYLLILMLAYIADARCRLELEECDTALQRLQKGIDSIRSRTRKYIELLLTSHPAIYLHPKLKGKVDLKRLTQIYQWIDPALTENQVFERHRCDFFKLAEETNEWKTDQWIKILPPAIFVKEQVDWNLTSSFQYWDRVRDAAFNALPEAMTAMETMIESYNRFEVYQLEAKAIHKLNISYHDWFSLTPNEVAPEGKLIFVTPSHPLSL